MNYPDDVTVLRPAGVDEYGNAAHSFDVVTEIPTKGFLAKPDLLLLPPAADVRAGDRVRVNGATYAAKATPLRSPTKRMGWALEVEEVET